MTAFSRALPGVVGSLAEAWAELRTHKLRVLLSLIGIGVAVAALTGVLALTAYQKQAMIEQSDRWGGRVAMLQASLMPGGGASDPADGPITTAGFAGGGPGASGSSSAPVDWKALDGRVRESTERFDFAYTSRLVDFGTVNVPVQMDMVRQLPLRLVDPSYPAMHRLELREGRWFTPDDAEMLAPPVVISEQLWDDLGRTPLEQHPVLRMTGNASGVYPIIGVTPKESVWDTEHRAVMLVDGYLQRWGGLPAEAQMLWEFWAPEDRVAEIAPVLAMDLRSGAPAGTEVTLTRTDWATNADMAGQFDVAGLITGAIAGLILLLGGLGLLNVQLVAMRQRIREIGVRRSFGASGGRVFTAVMLESVVATAVAGLAGIALAVAAMRGVIAMGLVFSELQDAPSFPLGAALAGLAAAVGVGALAGLIPALVALRVRVIDAIRF